VTDELDSPHNEQKCDYFEQRGTYKKNAEPDSGSS
jgi:hypothetical protein